MTVNNCRRAQLRSASTSSVIDAMRYVWTDAGFENVIVEDYHPGCPMTDKLYPPIHPGEMLQEDVLDGYGITQHKLAVSIVCPRGGSTSSSTASDGSRPILHCAWAATLRPTRSSGSTCRPDTTLRSRRTLSGTPSTAFSRCGPHEPTRRGLRPSRDSRGVSAGCAGAAERCARCPAGSCR